MTTELKSWECPVCGIRVFALDYQALLVAVTYHFLEHVEYKGVEVDDDEYAFGPEENLETEGLVG